MGTMVQALRLRLFCLILIATLPFISARAEEAGRQTLSVSHGGRIWELRVYAVQTGEYVLIDELQEAIGGDIEWDETGLALTFRYGGGRFRFEDGIPFFSCDQRPYQLVDPPLLWKEKFLVPLQYLTDYLPYFYPDIFSFDRGEYALRDRRFYAFIREVRRSFKVKETVIFLQASASPRFDCDSSRPGTLQLNLFETRCNPDIPDSLKAFGYVDSSRVAESGTSTQLTFFLNPSVRHYRVAEVKSPPGISIVFSGEDLKGERRKEVDRDLVSGIIDPKEFQIKTVVIDPGHGGKDPGAIGRKGLKEKDINLKIALRLESLMTKQTRLEVVMTRKDDSYISLAKRTEIANRHEADLFISIHCNASKKSDARGFETYFLSVAKTDEERAVALRENLSVRFDEPSVDPSSLDDLQFIFWDLAQNEYLRESSDFAEIMCQQFGDGSKITSRGVRQAGFYVLNGAYMPSILVELGYISNTAEEKLLGDKEYQSELAGQIYRGIMSYIERYHQKIGG